MNLRRFGKVLSIRRNSSKAHVQWFYHGCKTVLEELAHPQELFLSDECQSIDLKQILTSCEVRKVKAGERPTSMRHHEFFYSYAFSNSDFWLKLIFPF